MQNLFKSNVFVYVVGYTILVVSALQGICAR